MSSLFAMPILLVVSLFAGAVIGSQWFPQKNGDPPRKFFKQGTAVALVVLCGVAFVVVVVLVMFTGGGGS